MDWDRTSVEDVLSLWVRPCTEVMKKREDSKSITTAEDQRGRDT